MTPLQGKLFDYAFYVGIFIGLVWGACVLTP